MAHIQRLSWSARRFARSPLAVMISRWRRIRVHSSSSPAPVRPEAVSTGGVQSGEAGVRMCRALR